MKLAEEFYLANAVLSRDPEAIRDHIEHHYPTRSWIEYIPEKPNTPIVGIDSPSVWENEQFQELVDCVQGHGRAKGVDIAVCLIQPQEVAR